MENILFAILITHSLKKIQSKVWPLTLSNFATIHANNFTNVEEFSRIDRHSALSLVTCKLNYFVVSLPKLEPFRFIGFYKVSQTQMSVYWLIKTIWLNF